MFNVQIFVGIWSVYVMLTTYKLYITKCYLFPVANVRDVQIEKLVCVQFLFAEEHRAIFFSLIFPVPIWNTRPALSYTKKKI